MFALDKASEANMLSDKVCDEFFFTWRWIPDGAFFCDDLGRFRAKSSAFDIRRDDQGKIKEPSASLFQLESEADDFLKGVAAIFGLLPFGKKTLLNSAVGALSSSQFSDLKKDPLFRSVDGQCFFEIKVSEVQKNKKIIHWDLIYSKDDMEGEIQALKTMLARICRCEPKPC